MAHRSVVGGGKQLAISVDDEGERLVASVVNTLFPAVEVPPQVVIELTGGELLPESHGSVRQWGEVVRAHLNRCAAEVP